MADHSTAAVLEIGTVVLSLTSEKIFTLKNVKHVLSIVKNLVSGSLLCGVGVVFNEMKGVYSQPDNILGRVTQHNNYGVDSGGYPKDIPKLTFEEFKELERFLFSFFTFLDGSTDIGMERVRLKLETPISIADRLLNSCVRLVKQDYQNASQDLISMNEMVSTVDMCITKMENQSNSWKKRIGSEIETAKTRAIKLVESTLKQSNVDLIATHAFKGERSGPLPATLAVQNEIINPALTDAQANPF